MSRTDFLTKAHRGTYEGSDGLGSFWRVTRTTSARWEVYRNGKEVFDGWTYGECVLYIDGEIREMIDPEYAMHKRRQRARRCTARAGAQALKGGRR